MVVQNYESGGLRIELPTGYSVVRTRGGRGGGRTKLPDGAVPVAPPSTPADPVPALLQQDFELVGTTQPIAADATALRGVRAPRVRVSVAADESALMLVERDGLLTWHAPSKVGRPVPPDPATRSPLRRAVATREVTFDVPLATTRATAADRGLIEKAGRAIAKVTVLKFVARVITEHVVEHLEAHIETRLVRIADPDPTTWQALTPPALGARAPRVLLFVHGTFSSTVGGFGALGGQDAGKALLKDALAAYDIVLGYDHRTLSVDPEQNAIDLLARLRAIDWPEPPVIDVVTHSRGALVARSLIEQVLPGANWPAEIGKIVFVAGPNAGTQLANYENWPKLLDLYTNLAAAAAKLIPERIAATILSGAIKGLGALAKAILHYSLTEDGVPGVTAMNPTSKYIGELNGNQAGQPAAGTTPWYVVESNFEPNLHGPDAPSIPARVRDWIVDHLADSLMAEPNDLVVNTASMAAIDSPIGAVSGFVRDRFDFAPDDAVFHTIYFQQARTATYLQGVLLGARQAAAPSPKRGPTPTPAQRVHLGVDLDLDLAHFPHESMLRRTILGAGFPRSGVLWPAAPPLPTAVLESRARAARPPARKRSKPRAKAKRAVAAPPVTAYFRAAMTDRAVVGKLTPLTCTIGRTPFGPLAAGQAADDGAAGVDAQRKITVQVIAKTNVEVVGPDRVDVDFPAGNLPLELFFDVRPLVAGEGELHVVARQGPVPLVTLVLKPTFAARATKSAVGNVGASAESVPSQARPTCVKQWLRITERTVGTDTVYDFDLQADDLKLLCTATSEPLTGGRQKYVDALYERIESRWISTDADIAAFSRELRALGGELWDELIPPELGKQLWKHRKKLTNVLILSDEPFIPWELVHLKNGPRLPAESWFLARLGAMRWLQGSYPPDVLTHERARLIAPDYPDESGLRLAAIADEAAFVRRQLGATDLTAESNAVLKALGKGGSVDLLHFAGHGEADETSARILLTGRMEDTADGRVYVADSLRDTTVGQEANLQGKDGRRAMVVLNACQAGRLTPKLTHVGGFAHAFIQAGAGAFISSLWSVGDEPASAFVQALYRRLTKGDTLAEATIAARAAAHGDAGDATWLAYVVYGDPCARFG